MKHSQHSTNCLRRGCLTSLVSSENLMCHRPWPIYFMPYSLSSSSQLSQLSTCCQKKKNLWVDITQLDLSFFPLHCFFVFVFLLEFLICKREKIFDVLPHVSLQQVARYYKGTGRRPCYAVLRYAMHAQCGGHYENAGIMGRDLLASRGGLCVFKQGPD